MGVRVWSRIQSKEPYVCPSVSFCRISRFLSVAALSASTRRDANGVK